MVHVRGPRDFWAGLLFIAIGAFAVVVAFNYPMGVTARMGPGYFPRALGSLLMILGALSVLRGLRQEGETLARWRLRPMIIVLASTVIFGHILQWAGLVLSVIFLVIASATADRDFQLKETLISAAGMAILCTVVFVVGLKIPLNLWPAFLGA